MKRKNHQKNKGMLIIYTLVFGAVAICIITALAAWAAISIESGRKAFYREQSFQAAEAGIDYYRWHLAHDPLDYQDGEETPGPYVHSLKDKNGITVGQFSLEITAPSTGSTLVKIKSTGSILEDSSVLRKIESMVAKPSIAKFAFAGYAKMRFGEGTEIFGPIHSNGGIRFDGLAHNVVTSGATTYDDPDHSGGNEIGVHTHVRVPPATGIDQSYQSAEANPSSIPSRPDVFEAGRLISQPTIDFSGFTTDLAILKSSAETDGFYRDAVEDGFVGYHIVLKTDNTFDFYKIDSWAPLGDCSGTSKSWSIGTETFQDNYPLPSNGIIFIEDHTVVDGQINNARLTITAADLPAPTLIEKLKKIIINNDISYTNYDGTDSIGLIGQGGVKVGMISDDDLKIDAALIAQNDNVGRFYYVGSACVYENRSVISLYGMIASHDRYGFAYVGGTGYITRNIAYDANILYAPPPSFPLTSDNYQILSWQEVKN